MTYQKLTLDKPLQVSTVAPLQQPPNTQTNTLQHIHDNADINSTEYTDEADNFGDLNSSGEGLGDNIQDNGMYKSSLWKWYTRIA